MVTFNYDTLLEEAFASLGMKFESLDDYVSRNDFKIIKLHGSVNWVREPTIPIMSKKVDPVLVANDVLKTADKMEFSDKYHLVPKAQRQQHIFSYITNPDKPGRSVVFPAIAIPLEKKTKYECPKEHVEALQECISRTDKLLIIGWKAAEENFVGLLSKGLEKEIPKMFVSRSKESAEKIHNTLINAGIDGAHWLLGEGGFRDEVRSGRIERFIGK